MKHYNIVLCHSCSSYRGKLYRLLNGIAIPPKHEIPGQNINITFIDGYTKFSDFATFAFSVPWFRGSARSFHVSFHSVK